MGPLTSALTMVRTWAPNGWSSSGASKALDAPAGVRRPMRDDPDGERLPAVGALGAASPTTIRRIV
jgi:hypothetical protein